MSALNAIVTRCREILATAPFMNTRNALLAENSTGCFYIYFSQRLTKDVEAMGFLTPRGGSYKSKSKKRVVIAKASRPILTKSDGSTVKRIELSNAGWVTTTLFEERNFPNAAAVECTLQK